MFLTYTRFKRPVPSVHSKEKSVTLATRNEYIQSCARTVILIGSGKVVTLKKYRSWELALDCSRLA